MAFNFESGTAADIADWFTKLEAFMLTLGWTIESGTGTQTIVFKSIGEGGGRVKLHCRFRQDGGSPNLVYYRVQDDIPGTNFTTEGTFAPAIDAGGGGAAPFDYWMLGDRDCVVVIFLTGGAYTGCYVGIVERFAVNVTDEEYEMVACQLQDLGSGNKTGYVLRKHEGTWDQFVSPFSFPGLGDYEKNPLDNSYMVAGVCVKEHDHAAFNDSIVGQLKHCSGRMATVTGLNAQDTIATGFGGATSWWTVFGVGANRWACHTGGNLPVGAWEGGFASTMGVAADMADLAAKLKAFLTARGWAEVANPAPAWPIDFYMNSPGQLGGDDIWMRWKFDTVQEYWGAYMMDDVTDSHQTASMYVGDPKIQAGDFPLTYFIAGDGDCFIHGVEIASIWRWAWFGMFVMYMGDPASIATPYKVGCMDGAATYQKRVLRDMDGNWNSVFTIWTDKYGNSSPNLLDGVSYIVWPVPLNEGLAGGPTPLGQPKYLHKMHSAALAVNDTVTIGARRYTYFADAQMFAYRDT